MRNRRAWAVVLSLILIFQTASFAPSAIAQQSLDFKISAIPNELTLGSSVTIDGNICPSPSPDTGTGVGTYVYITKPDGSEISEFSARSLNDYCSQTITVHHFNPDQPGTWSVYVDAQWLSAGSQQKLQSNAINFVVREEGFDISIPTQLGIYQGDSGIMTVYVESSSQRSYPVTLTITGLPQGATSSLSTNSENPPFSSLLTLQASSNTPTGQYTVTIEASGGGYQSTRILTLDIFEKPILIPPQPISFNFDILSSSNELTLGSSIIIEGKICPNPSTDTGTGIGTYYYITRPDGSQISDFSARTMNNYCSGSMTVYYFQPDMVGKWSVYSVAQWNYDGSKQELQSVTINFLVKEEGFDLSSTTTQLGIYQGESRELTINVDASSERSYFTSLNIPLLPMGVDYDFSPSTGKPPFTSTLTLSVAKDATVGPFTFVVTGEGGGFSSTHSISFDIYEIVITEPPPPSPTTTATTKVANTDFSVTYSISGGTLLGIFADFGIMSLVSSISTTQDGELTITIPRALLDSRIDGADNNFLVLVDGEQFKFDEIATSTDRTLTIQFLGGAGEIEIIGTQISVSQIPPTVTSPPQTPTPSTPPPAPSGTDVIIKLGSSIPGCEVYSSCFSPFTISVNVGETIIWYNSDTAAHTVTSGSAVDGPDGVFDSSTLMSGTTFSYKFTQAGNYQYFDMSHPWMKGIVIVEEIVSIPTPTPPSESTLEPPPSEPPVQDTKPPEEPEKIIQPSTIFVAISEKEIELRNSVTVSGSLSPALPSQIKLSIVRPDGTPEIKIVNSESNGAFSFTFTPSIVGTWKVQASWQGNENFLSSESNILSILLTEPEIKITQEKIKPEIIEVKELPKLISDSSDSGSVTIAGLSFVIPQSTIAENQETNTQLNFLLQGISQVVGNTGCTISFKSPDATGFTALLGSQVSTTDITIKIKQKGGGWFGSDKEIKSIQFTRHLNAFGITSSCSIVYYDSGIPTDVNANNSYLNNNPESVSLSTPIKSQNFQTCSFWFLGCSQKGSYDIYAEVAQNTMFASGISSSANQATPMTTIIIGSTSKESPSKSSNTVEERVGIANKYANTLFNPQYYADRQGVVLSMFSKDFNEGLFDPLNIVAQLVGIKTYSEAATAIKAFVTIGAVMKMSDYLMLLFIYPTAYSSSLNDDWDMQSRFEIVSSQIEKNQIDRNFLDDTINRLKALKGEIDNCPNQFLMFSSNESAETTKLAAKSAVDSAIKFLDAEKEHAGK